MALDTRLFEPIGRRDVEDHVFEMYVEHAPPESAGLGYLSRMDEVRVAVGDDEYLVQQSVSAFNSSNRDGTTGFVAWSTSKMVAEWLLQPSNAVFDAMRNSRVVELGSGVSGLLACSVGQKCSHYVCTDQQGVMKLLKKNISRNGGAFESSTIATKNTSRRRNVPRIDAVAFDWEHSSPEAVLELVQEYPDFIITCDTIYNPYLIPHLVRAAETLAGPQTGILVAVQLRESSLLNDFLVHAVDRFRVYRVPGVEDGYGVYYLEK
ncbi:hypothetical protein KL949_005336 [Ogataea haglerorum]|nr:hypothetical protein KL951_005285 [Ogataea haglerorum]KAG7713042.1 hypothetical protein KL949_005336 [Ogataea haglerorum]KAG7713171.1 hypothetical protein KL913_005298 [Ogataea haglerorum]KAG7762812.1 hypothetical protein KL931_005264 [Ogataea haglerorum]KAG7783333.1 hypothetical protein KL945_005267 [Ogataea haglerorum]